MKIGNPWTDAAFDNAGTTDFYRSHSLISDETYAAIQANCNYADELPVDAASNNTFCNRAVSEADADMAEIDIYNIYAESCNSNTSQNARVKVILESFVFLFLVRYCKIFFGNYAKKNMKGCFKTLLSDIIKNPCFTNKKRDLNF